MQPYDPMQDFYQRGIQFLFRQGVAVVIAVSFLGVTVSATKLVWGRMERMEQEFEAKIERNNREWKASLDIARQDWRDCESKREALAVKFAALEVEVKRLHKKK